jgi:hypothetical protein
LNRSQWFQDCKDYYKKEAFAEIPREELAEMLSGLGKEARKRIYTALESTDRTGAGIFGTIAHEDRIADSG